jgi:hypothetical protein
MECAGRPAKHLVFAQRIPIAAPATTAAPTATVLSDLHAGMNTPHATTPANAVHHMNASMVPVVFHAATPQPHAQTALIAVLVTTVIMIIVVYPHHVPQLEDLVQAIRDAAHPTNA